jgi:type IV secretory pathway VirJ component
LIEKTPARLLLASLLAAAAAASPQAPAASPALLSPAAPPAPEKLQLGRFGSFPVYRPAGTPAQVAVLLSPDLAAPPAARMAAALTGLGTLVIGVDAGRYAREVEAHSGPCSYAAADLETLSHFVEQRLGLGDYLPPVLVGEGSASSLAYATLAQSPPNTFSGAITTGFCRLLAFPKELCPGEGLHWEDGYKGPGLLLRPHELENPWVVLQGTPLPGCSSTGAAEFVPQVPGAQILPAFEQSAGCAEADAVALMARLKLALAVVAAKRQSEMAAQAARSEDIRDLPVVEMPATRPGRRTLMVIVSGDGGWVGLDRRIAELLNSDEAVPVVGLNSLQYFWKARTPVGAAADLARLLDHYLAAWKLDDAVVLGYSQGADVVPFMVDRLPPRLRSRVRLVVIVGTSGGASFDYNFATYMSGRKAKPDLPVKPEIARLKGTKVMCVYGSREKESLCRTLSQKVATPLELNTGHGFARQNWMLKTSILDALGMKPAGKPAPPAKPERAGR